MRKKITFVGVATLVPVIVHAGPLTTAQPIIVGLTNILNFLLSIVGVVAIIGLVIAGGMYFFAAGDMRQISLAKKMSWASITGIVLALGSYVVLKLIALFLS
jgi:type IV secretory pathway VirB2 component (pilin)